MMKRKKDDLRKALNKVKKTCIINYFVENAEMINAAKWERAGLRFFKNFNTVDEINAFPPIKILHDVFSRIVKSDLERLLKGETFEQEFYQTRLEYAVKWYLRRIKKIKLVDYLAWLWASTKVDHQECFDLAREIISDAETDHDSYEQARNDYSYYMTRGRNQYTRGIGSREKTHELAARKLFRR